jgi:ubiquinone/menaquinone biosynthesis C-methylase UbiE
VIAGPLVDEEGIIYMDVDPLVSVEERQILNINGYYSRFDIFNTPLRSCSPKKKHMRVNSMIGWDKILSRTFGKEVSTLYLAYIEELIENGVDREEVDAFLNEYSAPVGVIFNILMLSRSGMTIKKFKKSTEFLLSQRKAVEEILKEVEPSSKILDIGCGSGLLTCLIALKGFNIEGTDISDKALNVANKLAYKLGCNIGFTLFEGGHLPQQDTAFDYIIFNSSIHEIRDNDRLQVLREACRVLKRGGRFIIIDQEGVASFDAIKCDLLRTGLEMKTEQLLQPVFDHGKSSRILKWIYLKK